jgi:hypothetical protein
MTYVSKSTQMTNKIGDEVVVQIRSHEIRPCCVREERR